MDLVDEKNVSVLEIGQQGHEVPRLLDERSRTGFDIYGKFVRHDVRERRLAEARRPIGQEMIHRLATCAGCLHGDPELIQDLLLAHVLGEAPRPKTLIEGQFLIGPAKGDQTLRHDSRKCTSIPARGSLQ